MLMVIFGAGASYDSVPANPPRALRDHEDRPPLADQLFEDRVLFASAMNQFPACQPIIPLLRVRRDNRSVEQVLEHFQGEVQAYPARAQQLAAIRYYLHFMLTECKTEWDRVARGITNYRTLLDQIERWRYRGSVEDMMPLGAYTSVCLVTFNYDTLLEDAFGKPINGLGDYIADSSYKLIKAHGSVNWGRVVRRPLISDVATRSVWEIAYELISRASELDLGPDYHRVVTRPIGRLDEATTLFPAIAIPVVQKSAFECPADHVAALMKCIPEVTKLLIIGWRGTEQHFVS